LRIADGALYNGVVPILPSWLTQDTPLKLLSRLALAALLAALLLPLASPARAQDPVPVTLDVQAGYDSDGQFRVGHWFPVTVVASNDGPDLKGAIEWRFPGDNGGVFRYDLDLPRGARKRITLPVVTSEANGNAAVALVDGQNTLVRRPVRLDPVTTDQLALGVLSADPTLLNSLRAIQLNGAGAAVIHLDPARFPDDAALLAGLDAIFVNDVATADLSEAQREALALWTRLGGELVVGGGPGAERTAPGLAPLLPVEVGQLRPDVSAASLNAVSGGQAGSAPPALTANAVTLREGARDLDGAGLLSARDEGAGRVIFAAFDLGALRAWAGESALWQATLRPEPRAHLGQSFRLRSENLLRDSLQSAALRLPSTAVLLLLMALYIAVVGPLNFWLLRRARRVELAWITTPLIVAGFLAAAYGASFALRGTRPQISQLAIVQGFEGAPRAQSTAFLGVFSPQRRSYRLELERGTLITPGSFEGFSFRAVPVSASDSAAAVDDLLIDVSSLRTLMVEHGAELAPAVQSALTVGQGSVQGELTLTGGPALSDAVVVIGDSAQAIGDLRPGASAKVDLRDDLGNFPDQSSFSDGGLFNRGGVMYSLFGYDRFSQGGPTFQGEQGIPDRDGVYLIGWADGAGLPATIDGDPGRQQGETLYIIRLDARP
jgi:hypothetical protein